MYLEDWPPTGRKPSRQESDAHWGELNRLSVEAMKASDWVQYSYVRYRQAHHLGWERRWAQALDMIIECIYLELNGPQDPEAVAAGLAIRFDPDRFYGLAPVQVEIALLALIRTNTWKEEAARVAFLKATDHAHKNLHTPIPPERAWQYARPNWFRYGKMLLEGYEEYFAPTEYTGFGAP